MKKLLGLFVCGCAAIVLNVGVSGCNKGKDKSKGGITSSTTSPVTEIVVPTPKKTLTSTMKSTPDMIKTTPDMIKTTPALDLPPKTTLVPSVIKSTIDMKTTPDLKKTTPSKTTTTSLDVRHMDVASRSASPTRVQACIRNEVQA